MIEIEFPTYTDAQWNEIKAVIRDELGLDADQIERQVTIRNVGPDFGESFTGMETLRSRIENAVRQYHLYDGVNDLSVLAPTATRLLRDAARLRSVLTAIYTLLEHHDAVVNVHGDGCLREFSLRNCAAGMRGVQLIDKALAMLDERTLAV
jgi:hypothetical protein